MVALYFQENVRACAMKAAYRSSFLVNLVAFCLVIVLIIVAKIAGTSVGELFQQPRFSIYPTDSLLTHTFQLLCAFPFIVCAFSFGLLKALQPNHLQNRFVLASAFLTGGFLLNEIFRIHIHLVMLGVPKLVTVSVYAIVALWYAAAWHREIRKTPYLLLLIGTSFLFTGIVIDAMGLGTSSFSMLLEGIPKLFSEINMVLYFWLVCHFAIIRSIFSGTAR
jgi:hypothetical protein